MAMPVWEQVYAAYRRRNRIFTRVGTSGSLYEEVMNGITVSTEVLTNAQGDGALDLSGMNFKRIVHVFIQPISADGQPANGFSAFLAGRPTTTRVSIKTTKPILSLAGLQLLPVPTPASVYVLVLGIP